MKVVSIRIRGEEHNDDDYNDNAEYDDDEYDDGDEYDDEGYDPQ